MFFVSIITVLVVLVFSSCESLQINEKSVGNIVKAGGAIIKANEEITPSQEYYIGRAVGANILVTYKLQTNKPALVAYANNICNALVINSERPEIYNGYHVNILDSDEINAFATPGGHIFITRSLIASATSEDTLAAVIAHEIGHIQLQHGLNAIKSDRKFQAGLATANALASLKGKDLEEVTSNFGVSVDGIVNVLNKGYSRDQEFEADTKAMELLAKAGYEPSSLIDVLRVLEKTQSAHSGGFNSTHPTPTQRIANAQKTVGNYKVTDTRSYRQARFNAVK